MTKKHNFLILSCSTKVGKNPENTKRCFHTSKVLCFHQLTNLQVQLQLSWKIQPVSLDEKEIQNGNASLTLCPRTKIIIKCINLVRTLYCLLLTGSTRLDQLQWLLVLQVWSLCYNPQLREIQKFHFPKMRY